MSAETFSSGYPPSFEAAADLSAKQGFFAVVNSSGKLEVCSSQGQHMDGVIGMADPMATGGSASLLGRDREIIPFIVGANGVTRGSEVTTDATAKGENASSGDWVAGKCLVTAASGATSWMLACSPYLKA